MKICAEITVSGNAGELDKLFLSEKHNAKTDRARFTTSKKGKDFFITIDAEDSTAFRALATSISKLLTIYEKTDTVIKDEN